MVLAVNQILKKHVCRRCGRCCLGVGRTFWKGGDFSEFADLDKRANNGDYEDGGQPCEMLYFKRGKATCLIEERCGREAKPKACRNYPEEGELCFMQEVFIVKTN